MDKSENHDLILELRKFKEEILNRLTEIEIKIELSSESSKDDKFRVLESKVRTHKRLTVDAVKKIYGCSHPWALDRMQKLGKLSGFQFVKGSKELHRQSMIVFVPEEESAQMINEIKDYVDLHGEATVAEISKYFHLDVETWLPTIRTFFNKIVSESEKYQNRDGNRLVKTINS